MPKKFEGDLEVTLSSRGRKVKIRPQQEFPNFRPDAIKDIDEAADDYRSACDELKEAQGVKKQRAEELAARMAKYNVPLYRLDDDYVLALEDKRSVSLKKIKSLRAKAAPQEGDATKAELAGHE